MRFPCLMEASNILKEKNAGRLFIKIKPENVSFALKNI